MFGYVTAMQPELRVRELEAYKALYCGLCRRLKLDYGVRATMGLSYDLVFLTALGLALAEEDPVMEKKHCAVYLIRKKNAIQEGEVLHYAAAMQVLLAAAKLEDDVADETGSSALVAKSALALLASARRQAAQRYPERQQDILRSMSALQEAERGQPLSLDGYAHHSGHLIGRLAQPLGHGERDCRVLYTLGYQIGRWIYLLDAMDDYPEDVRLGRFNPLAAAGYSAQQCLDGTLQQLLADACLAANAALQLLPLRRYQGILENILLLGMPYQVRHAVAQQKEGAIAAEGATTTIEETVNEGSV